MFLSLRPGIDHFTGDQKGGTHTRVLEYLSVALYLLLCLCHCRCLCLYVSLSLSLSLSPSSALYLTPSPRPLSPSLTPSLPLPVSLREELRAVPPLRGIRIQPER